MASLYSISSVRLVASHTRSFAPPADEIVAIAAAAEVCAVKLSIRTGKNSRAGGIRFVAWDGL
jgi:hypothetical protein